MIFDWGYVWDIAPRLAEGLVVTLQATVLGMAVALTLGLVLALARRSRYRLVGWPTSALVEFVRSTPLLVQIYFLFYILPDAGLRLSPLATGVLALGLHYAAYCSEVYRAGLESVPKGQWEAAVALNLSRWRTMKDIIIPQAIPPVVPALGNYLVAMFKDTPLLSAITVLEVLQAAKLVGSETFRYVEPLTLVGVLFLVLSLLSATAIRWVEGRVRMEG
ncbi:MAG: ectoine/hydroxyectoine ABC transporter permease subunit EhuD [Betaproteobacteria bacterium]|nr:ectoine/hydroxyectoine ABC transporter permease subunit EhuD [Betaproteobacteria bacterium]MDH3436628.1 ectoine/hydroxyectoine ABC transporter permease subunit EhuD [Betaproteobacteria bacterium]